MERKVECLYDLLVNAKYEFEVRCSYFWITFNIIYCAAGNEVKLGYLSW
jgi:hypothetical protein